MFQMEQDYVYAAAIVICIIVYYIYVKMIRSILKV